MSYILEAHSISKSFSSARDKIELLEDVNLSVESGRTVSITGKSGSGKSTLLYMLSSLLKPDTGSVLIDGSDIYGLGANEVAKLRNGKIGFVFQDSRLLNELTLEENVFIPIEIYGRDKAELKSRIKEIAAEIGVADRLKHRASELSGGEKSRAALLRALAVKPKVVFLDEPTGALDNENARKLEDLIISLSKEFETSFLYVTHDTAFASRAEKRFEIKNRHLVSLC